MQWQVPYRTAAAGRVSQWPERKALVSTATLGTGLYGPAWNGES